MRDVGDASDHNGTDPEQRDEIADTVRATVSRDSDSGLGDSDDEDESVAEATPLGGCLRVSDGKRTRVTHDGCRIRFPNGSTADVGFGSAVVVR